MSRETIRGHQTKDTRTSWPVFGRISGALSPKMATAPPVGSPTKIAGVKRSRVLTKFIAAENVSRPMITNKLPRRCSFGDLIRRRRTGVVRAVLPPGLRRRSRTILVASLESKRSMVASRKAPAFSRSPSRTALHWT